MSAIVGPNASALVLQVADPTPPPSPSAPSLEQRQLTELVELTDLTRQAEALYARADASPVARANMAARIRRALFAASRMDDNVTARRMVLLRALEMGVSVRRMVAGSGYLTPAQVEWQGVSAARVVLERHGRMLGLDDETIGAAVDAWASPGEQGRWTLIHALAEACECGGTSVENFRTRFSKVDGG